MLELANRDGLVTENTGLVHSCCKRFVGKGVEYDDLFQAGCVGLVKASKGFDSGRGLQFSTYAVPAILGEIKRLFRDGGTIKVSRSLKELSLKTTRCREKLLLSLGREPTVFELSERLETEPEMISMALCAAQPVISLTQSGEDGETQLDIPAGDDEQERIDALSLQDVLSGLPADDRRLIVLRYFNNKTQTQTAQLMGISQVQVSRREKVILAKLRHKLAG